MPGTRVARGRQYASASIAILFVLALSAEAAAQFRLPKIPKLGKSEQTQQQQKNAPTGPMPEVSAIEPNSASPGAEGDLVVTGKNFTSGTKLRISCQSTTPKINSVKVESATKIVTHVKFPYQLEEGPCEIYLEARVGGDETGASSSGTPQIVQVKTTNFKIAKSSPLPLSLPVVYVGEGNMDFMAIMMKVQQAMQGSWGDSGKPLLRVTSSEAKLIEGDKTTFTVPASGVKEIGQMSMMGQNVGVFRIVCTDGKIYNFMEQTGDGLEKGQTVAYLKNMLGK